VTETCGHQGKKYNIIYCCADWNKKNILFSLSLENTTEVMVMGTIATDTTKPNNIYKQK
jgi:hypothetical protein